MQTSLQFQAFMAKRTNSARSLDRITLPDGIVEKLASVSRRVRYKQGALIHQEGDLTDSLCIVTSGRISGYRLDQNGRSGTAYIVGVGSAFGLFPLLAKRSRSHNCEAIEDSEIAHVGYHEIWSLIENDAEVRQRIFMYLCDRLSLAYDVIEEDRYLPLPKRLARRLDDFADDDDCLRLTQQQLADQMGVSRVAIGSSIKRLSELGFLETGYGKLTLLDRQKMRNWSAGMELSD